MSVTVRIPSPLRRFTGDEAKVTVEGRTVQDTLDTLVAEYQELRPQLYGENGRMRNFVNVYVRGRDIRALDGLKTPLNDGDEVMIIPAIAGGNGENSTFDRQEYLRYSRHFALPEIGVEGQVKLKKASVLVVGAGGLGSPASFYLAAAGVGRLGLVDFDRVDLTNLQRQILYGSSDVGKSKLEVAGRRLSDLNPNVDIALHSGPLTSVNAMDIVKDYDLVIDGTDNFPTRYLVNDVCVFQGKPNVYGSIFRFDGQVSVFDASRGPCYRCLYPDPPPPGLVPSCAEGGVLGVLPGIVGSLQAAEAIKWITGVGDILSGRLLLFDALSVSFQEVSLRKDPECVVCGDAPTITEPIDYEGFCGMSGTAESVSVPEISATEVNQKLRNDERLVILDVREAWEREISHLDEALFIPMGEIPSRLDELDPSEEIVVHCHVGPRSARVTEYLIQHGYTRVKNMRGGIRAWVLEVDPSLASY